MQLKTLLGAALLLLAGAAQAQTIPETTPEPEFIGEIVTVRPDGTVAKLSVLKRIARVSRVSGAYSAR